LSPARVARDLMRLHRDRKLLAWLRWSSRRAAERWFDATFMAERTLQAYREVLAPG